MCDPSAGVKVDGCPGRWLGDGRQLGRVANSACVVEARVVVMDTDDELLHLQHCDGTALEVAALSLAAASNKQQLLSPAR